MSDASNVRLTVAGVVAFTKLRSPRAGDPATAIGGDSAPHNDGR